MIDPMRFPVADIADLYAHRWELGYREMKQYMLKNELTLRSKKPEMVRQELWGALLDYNLIRFQIGKMGYSLDSTLPIQLSFSRASAYIIQQLSIMPHLSPAKIFSIAWARRTKLPSNSKISPQTLPWKESKKMRISS